MLSNTFCHIPGIGLRTEESLWEGGARSWDECLELVDQLLPKRRRELVCNHLYESEEQLREFNANFFVDTMPVSEQWRLFREFRSRIAYIDIETTGLDSDFGSYITTIVLYDGEQIRHYINGENLSNFKDDIFDYDVLVTYNGKSFDIPFIERYFMIELPQPQIDLRHVLASLGFRGGLKGCEQQLGINRGTLEEVDGYFAVLLWHDFHRSGNAKALDTLLAYNVEDTVNLEYLMIEAYNRKIATLPFAQSHTIRHNPKTPANPFVPDPDTIDRLKWYFGARY
jgi:uncharacterized protein YprB with RNaseH-like and TPR domain